MSTTTFSDQLKIVLMPPSGNLSANLLPLFAGGAFGYFYFAPMIGASDQLAALLVTWACARSGAKIGGAEYLGYESSASSSAMLKVLAWGVLPLGAMYASAQVMPLSSVSGGLLAFAVYAASAAALSAYSINNPPK